jgi:hypothetical protein
MGTFPSENILKLRELSAKLCEINDVDDYKNIIVEVKNLVENSKAEMIKNKTSKEKVKCYENMCTNITNILQKLI